MRSQSPFRAPHLDWRSCSLPFEVPTRALCPISPLLPTHPSSPTLPLPTDTQPSSDFDAPRPRGARWTTLLAIFLVVAIGGGALFVSGFALGRLAGATPGTTADNQDLFRPFWDAYNDITQNYVGKVDEHLLVEGAIGGLFTALGDPFSQYLTQEQYTQQLSGISGEFTGVGVQVRDPGRGRQASATRCPTRASW